MAHENLDFQPKSLGSVPLWVIFLMVRVQALGLRV